MSQTNITVEADFAYEDAVLKIMKDGWDSEEGDGWNIIK